MDIVDAVAAALEADGYAVARDMVGARETAVARRARFHGWTLTRLHFFVFLITMDEPTVADARRLRDECRRYARLHKRGLPPGWQTGIASVPTLIVRTAAPALLDWAQSRQERHWATIDFPVVVDLTARTGVYRSDRDPWGRAYAGELETVVGEIKTAFSRSGDATPTAP